MTKEAHDPAGATAGEAAERGPSEPAKRRRGRGAAIVAGGLVVVAVAGGIGYLAWQNHQLAIELAEVSTDLTATQTQLDQVNAEELVLILQAMVQRIESGEGRLTAIEDQLGDRPASEWQSVEERLGGGLGGTGDIDAMRDDLDELRTDLENLCFSLRSQPGLLPAC